jgi:hypothetical protein
LYSENVLNVREKRVFINLSGQHLGLKDRVQQGGRAGFNKRERSKRQGRYKKYGQTEQGHRRQGNEVKILPINTSHSIQLIQCNR